MIDNPNTIIEQLFKDFAVDGKTIPVAFLRYNGSATTYVTYQQAFASNPLSGDDELENRRGLQVATGKLISGYIRG